MITTNSSVNNLAVNTLTVNIDKVKTLYPIFSKYSDYKGKVNFVYIPINTELYVTEVYPNYGVDVFYGDRNIYLDFEEIEVV